MKGLIQWLNRPYPYDDPTWKKMGVGLLVGLFVFLFLAVFQPFGLDGNYPYKILTLLGYGAVTWLAYVFVDFLVPLISPKLFRDESWTVGKELAMHFGTVGLIAAGNFAYTALLGYTTWNFGNLLLFLFYTFLIGIFPITMGVLATQIKLLKRHQGTSNAINNQIEGHVQEVTANDPVDQQVDLYNEEGKLELSLSGSMLLFLAAADNYVEVHHRANGELQKQLIRSSLKRLESALPKDAFFRCHRSYLVNLHQVTHAEGNSAGLRLTLQGYEGSVPVSRSKASAFQTQFARFN